MSALWVPDDHSEELRERPAGRPVLRAIPGAFPRLARVPFILVLVGIFGLGMTGLLMLNTTLQNQAFQASTLNRQATELAYTQADLESQLDRQAAPQILAQRASAYGLRANPYPAFLVLPQGKVVGTPRAVKGNELPSMIVKTPAQLAAERAAAAARLQAKTLQAAADARAKALAARQAALAQQQADVRKAAEAKKKTAESKKSITKKSTPKKSTAKKTGGRG
jgi:Tfp pilus assembly protein PilN